MAAWSLVTSYSSCAVLNDGKRRLLAFLPGVARTALAQDSSQCVRCPGGKAVGNLATEYAPIIIFVDRRDTYAATNKRL